MIWLMAIFLVLAFSAYALGLHMRRKAMRASMNYIRKEMEQIKQNLSEAKELHEKSL